MDIDSADFFNEAEFEEIDDLYEYRFLTSVSSSPEDPEDPDNLEDPDIEAITLALADTELNEDTMPLTLSKKFLGFPEEIQMRIWKFSALQEKRTITMRFGQEYFKFINCPRTPAFMHVCQRSRTYGMEIFKTCDAYGRQHDIRDPTTIGNFYFYVNPFGDDFILRFGKEKRCPQPVFCSFEASSSYMMLDMAASERRLEAEHAEMVESIEAGGGFNNPSNVAGHGPWQFNPNNVLGNPAHVQTASQAAVAGIDQAQPAGVPVFPPYDQLPEFFTNIRSVLDKFPNLEYAFAVVRAHGRSNMNSSEGIGREIEKKKWAEVAMAKGKGTIMGKEEFQQVEKWAKVWFMNHRMLKELPLNDFDFELYVQTDIQWEI
ncbi:hypothetical protein DID88_004998 [Monilinia fructigena]|uniref:2EXR domain-containing protein n=1 Tax=Monilinia fructigena TaxID=38457 RepID=A0A395IQ77_9HELO|nr:hypothetical protein DID88_004998 [Monilinia fructigena]